MFMSDRVLYSCMTVSVQQKFSMLRQKKHNKQQTFLLENTNKL